MTNISEIVSRLAEVSRHGHNIADADIYLTQNDYDKLHENVMTTSSKLMENAGPDLIVDEEKAGTISVDDKEYDI